MKTQELDIGQLSLNLDASQSKNQFNLIASDKPRCLGQYQAKLVCMNPKCSAASLQKVQDLKNIKKEKYIEPSYPFICQNPSCEECYGQIYIKQKDGQIIVRKPHFNCVKGDYQSLFACLKLKIKKCDSLKESINKIFDNIIDCASSFKQDCLQDLKYHGLLQQEKYLCKLFDSKSYDQIRSSQFSTVFKQIDKELIFDASIVTQKLQQYWNNQRTKIYDIIGKIFEIIAQEPSWITIESNILQTEKQKFNLSQMIENNYQKPIQSFQLLYRASQYDFYTEQFHKICDFKKDTVVLIESEFGYKIGGYTPIQWNQTKNGVSETDPNKESFIFSLTNNHKFTLRSSNTTAIIQSSLSGPAFGPSQPGGSDLFIDYTYGIGSICVNIGNGYTHPQYEFKKQQGLTKFCGVKTGKSFYANDWEVYQVKWRPIPLTVQEHLKRLKEMFGK